VSDRRRNARGPERIRAAGSGTADSGTAGLADDSSTGSQAAPRSSPGGSAAGHRRSVRSEVVWRVVRSVLDQQVVEAGRPVLDVVDAGGGTGGFAVPVARIGHRVTVVDPSPDSLAALQRRAAESGVTERVSGVQADAADLLDLIEAGTADVVLCHNVLEYVDDPSAALRAMGEVLRPGGALSLVAANRNAVVLAKVLAGHIAEAQTVLTESVGRWGHRGPQPRRFTAEQLRAEVERVGLVVRSEQGVRIFTDLVPGAFADEPGASAALLDLEAAAADDPAFRAIATQMHLWARRG
jgi:S-adenosylmethionine-dependent methyltransferase